MKCVAIRDSLSLFFATDPLEGDASSLTSRNSPDSSFLSVQLLDVREIGFAATAALTFRSHCRAYLRHEVRRVGRDIGTNDVLGTLLVPMPTLAYFLPLPLVCARSLPATLFTFFGVFGLERSLPALEASLLLVPMILDSPPLDWTRLPPREPGGLVLLTV